MLFAMIDDGLPPKVISAFIDSNIVLEGKTLSELPWNQIIDDGLIRVLIVPKAMEEIDAKKRDGRLGSYARSFNRLIAPHVVTGKPVVLREAAPRVELEMVACSPISWRDYDELDPDDGDSRIVAEVLNARNVAPDNCLLVSHDIKPLAYARGRELPVHKATDEWLRDPEPSPKDKQIQRLKQKIAELTIEEPRFEISIDVSDVNPPKIYRVAALDDEKANALLKNIRSLNPRKENGSQDGYTLSAFGDHDSSYDEKYDRFISRTIPHFVKEYHKRIELLFNQRHLKIFIKNTGPIRADHFVLTVKLNQGWMNEKLVVVSPAGPRAPTPVPSYMRYPMHNEIPLRNENMFSRVGRHEFETTVRPKKSKLFEATCEDFRSGQDFAFEGVVSPTAEDEPLEITVGLTAKNLRGEVVETFSMNKEIERVSAERLVDLSVPQLRETFPTHDELNRLIEADEYDRIEWDDDYES